MRWDQCPEGWLGEGRGSHAGRWAPRRGVPRAHCDPLPTGRGSVGTGREPRRIRGNLASTSPAHLGPSKPAGAPGLSLHCEAPSSCAEPKPCPRLSLPLPHSQGLFLLLFFFFFSICYYGSVLLCCCYFIFIRILSSIFFIFLTLFIFYSLLLFCSFFLFFFFGHTPGGLWDLGSQAGGWA